MKKCGILNPSIISAVAALGHTEYFCIADCGLPIPKGVEVIDVSVTAGTPTFMQLLNAVSSELVIESYIVASELLDKNPSLMMKIEETLSGREVKKVPHEELKKLTEKAKCIIRTGEILPFANVILVGGVNF